MKTGIEIIAEERTRQIEVLGRTPERDSVHKLGEMAGAAAVYALNSCGFLNAHTLEADRPGGARSFKARIWPWHDDYWKPSEDRVRDLAKAGALIAAEIDRIQRTRSGCIKQPSPEAKPTDH